MFIVLFVGCECSFVDIFFILLMVRYWGGERNKRMLSKIFGQIILLEGELKFVFKGVEKGKEVGVFLDCCLSDSLEVCFFCFCFII